MDSPPETAISAEASPPTSVVWRVLCCFCGPTVSVRYASVSSSSRRMAISWSNAVRSICPSTSTMRLTGP